MKQPTDYAAPPLGRLELLGAWLRVWTPPRGAVIPPVPWKRITWIAATIAGGLTVAAVLVVPNTVRSRAAAAEGERRAAIARHDAFLASVDRTQAPKYGRGDPDPQAAAPAATRTRLRAALVAAASSAIEADAAAASDKPIQKLACQPFPVRLDALDPIDDLTRRRAAYDCTAVTASFNSRATGSGLIGIPFRLVVRFSEGTFAWCGIVPLGDRDRLSHPLPPACRTAAG